MDPEGFDPSEQQFASSLEQDESYVPASESETQQLAAASLATVAGRDDTHPLANVDSTAADSLERATAETPTYDPDMSPVDDAELWKDAVASRIRNYKARRYRKLGQGSFRFNFESTTGNHVFLKPEFPFDIPPADQPGPENRIDTGHAIVVSCPSNAAPVFDEAPERELATEEPEEEKDDLHSRPARGPVPEQGKLIEFPRPSYMTHTVTELAEPVLTSPRILDVPEIVPVPPPPLDGLCLETPVETNEQPLEVPLQVVSVSRRLFAAVLDAFIVLLATAVFGMVAMKVGPEQLLQDRRSTIAVALVVPALLWIMYQYVFLTYAAITPGMQLVRLRILHFEGKPVARRLRQYRALMLLVSCCPAGLGFLWAFYDPDTLCWHDRITRTYVASQPH